MAFLPQGLPKRNPGPELANAFSVKLKPHHYPKNPFLEKTFSACYDNFQYPQNIQQPSWLPQSAQD